MPKKISIARRNKIQHVVSARQGGLVVVLEDIHDPHNVGAIVRSCDAFGVQDVYVIFEHETPYNPKQIGKSSSATANKWVDFHLYHSTKKCLTDLKKKGYKIFATVLDQKSRSIFKTKFTDKKIALVLGNEHSGISQSAKQFSDQAIYIPMRGMAQSLNVSVTAAVILYEITRQRGHVSLLPAARKKLEKDFLRR